MVLLDLKMPNVDGIEVIRTVKGDETLKMIRVVKQIYFQDFMKAVREIGVFWAVVNEPPPVCIGRARTDPVTALSATNRTVKGIPLKYPIAIVDTFTDQAYIRARNSYGHYNT